MTKAKQPAFISIFHLAALEICSRTYFNLHDNHVCTKCICQTFIYIQIFITELIIYFFFRLQTSDDQMTVRISVDHLENNYFNELYSQFVHLKARAQMAEKIESQDVRVPEPFSVTQSRINTDLNWLITTLCS